jgi:hypothetical protein
MKVPILGAVSSLVAGEFDHDGTLDLAAVGGDSQQNYLTIVPARVDGSFGPSRHYTFSNLFFGMGGLVAGDFRGNGRLDLAIGIPSSPFNSDPETVMILENDGSGRFKRAGSIELADVNALTTLKLSEGNREDLVAADDGQITVFLKGREATSSKLPHWCSEYLRLGLWCQSAQAT